MLNKTEIEFNSIEQNDDWKGAFMDIKRADEYLTFSPTFTNAKNLMNLKYNRYKDILPYDHSRVKLKGLQETDYINANFVECKKANRKYILAQAPLKNTCQHFWQMVWEQNTKGIVMLNRLYEKGIPKCEMYYPNTDEENSDLVIEFDKFRLNYLSERPFKDYSIRIIECENLEQKEKREIYHCHFTNWPDFGEPEYTSSFLEFLQICTYDLDIFNSELYGPPVIHCSAGVGRSGTFILIDSMIQLHKNFGNEIPIGVNDLLGEFRTYRLGLVQTYQQFKFAYQSIVDYIRKAKMQENQSSNLASNNINGMFSNQIDDDDDDEDDILIEENSFSSSDEEEAELETLSKRKSKSKQRPDSSNNLNFQKSNIKLVGNSKNHIKKLRQLQFENRNLNNDFHNDMNSYLNLKTAVNENTNLNSDTNGLSLSFSNAKQFKVVSDKVDSSWDDQDDEDEEDKPFASNRNVSTVKLNTKRKSLEIKTPQQNEDQINLVKRNTVLLTTNVECELPKPNAHVASPKIKSERDQRIMDKINEIKQKQRDHEQNRNKLSYFNYDNLSPLLVGGGIFIGGLVLHQLYKMHLSR